MKKKEQPRPLQLSRETLSQLENTKLTLVFGGSLSWCQTICQVCQH
jgi:hypothetical protein